MSRIAYVNGRYVPHGKARVHIDDRGYQFGDGIYEVCAVRAGTMIDDGPHLDRLERSLREMRMAMPMSREALKIVMRETIRRNLVNDGIVYIVTELLRAGGKRCAHAHQVLGRIVRTLQSPRSSRREWLRKFRVPALQ